MPRQPVFCYGHNQSVTDTYSVKACTKDVANEANSNNFPRKGTISHVEGEVSAIAGGALNAIWFLAWDAAGDRPLFPAFTSSDHSWGDYCNQGWVQRDRGYRVHYPR